MATYLFTDIGNGVELTDPIIENPRTIILPDVEQTMKIDVIVDVSVVGGDVSGVELSGVSVNNLTYDSVSLMERIQEHLDIHYLIQ